MSSRSIDSNEARTACRVDIGLVQPTARMSWVFSLITGTSLPPLSLPEYSKSVCSGSRLIVSRAIRAISHYGDVVARRDVVGRHGSDP